MGKLQRELKCLKRNVQRVRTKLQKLQHDLTLALPQTPQTYHLNNSSIDMIITQ